MDYSKYVNQLEYPAKPKPPIAPVSSATAQAFRDHADALDRYSNAMNECILLREKYNDKNAELYAAFKVDALKEVGLWAHNAGNRAFEVAWDIGHANGYQEVFIHLERMAYVVLGEK